MKSTNSTPKHLEQGIYWYVVPGRKAEICEKRDGEDFVRFTNGSHLPWIHDGAIFMGPLEAPSDGGAGSC